jgi:3-deoxy-D-manno-octulosonate 8-phosphate phosphatase (KDO 8-P phosphatase)
MNILELFKPVKTFVFDVDGVLATDMLLIVQGDWVRSMNIKDGFGLQLAVKKGYRVVIISGAKSVPVMERLAGLGINDIFLGVSDKKEKLLEYVQQYDLKWEEILFMGDDIPDLSAMQLVGMPCCPADAVTEIKLVSKYISPVNGGSGCGRDVIEKVLKLNGHWDVETGIAAK